MLTYIKIPFSQRLKQIPDIVGGCGPDGHSQAPRDGIMASLKLTTLINHWNVEFVSYFDIRDFFTAKAPK
jgi:hypothetical protein